MKIRINGQDLSYSIENETTVGEILGAIETECEKNGMTVTEISFDGKKLDAAELDSFFAKPPAEVDEVNLTAISGARITSMFAAIGAQLADLVPRLSDIPVLLQTGKDDQVMGAIGDFSSTIEDLYRLLPLGSVAGIPEERLTVEGEPLAQYQAELTPLLRDLVGALEQKDTILVGDLAEYEIAPRIQRIGAVLSALA